MRSNTGPSKDLSENVVPRASGDKTFRNLTPFFPLSRCTSPVFVLSPSHDSEVPCCRRLFTGTSPVATHSTRAYCSRERGATLSFPSPSSTNLMEGTVRYTTTQELQPFQGCGLIPGDTESGEQRAHSGRVLSWVYFKFTAESG